MEKEKEECEIAKGFVMLPRCMMESLFIMEKKGLITHKDISVFLIIASESISWKNGRKKYVNGRPVKLKNNECVLSFGDIEDILLTKGNISRSVSRLKNQGIIKSEIPKTNRDKVIYKVEVDPEKWIFEKVKEEDKKDEVIPSPVETSPSESKSGLPEAGNKQSQATGEEFMMEVEAM